jgi:predicted nuclease of restriction endonuclease-like RecB superfamily
MQNFNVRLTIDEEFLKHQLFQVADDILCSHVEDEAVLLHVTEGTYYSLSETSIPFWEALQNQQPLKDVVEKIIAEYEVEYSQLITNLQGFIENLMEYGMISPISV